jgi:uncharacterized protein
MLAVDILLVGASVRAAAASAIRAGLRPWCLDLFADADLRQMAPSVRCPPSAYPRGLLPIFRDAPQAPWLYTGGLENHPTLIRRMAELRPLWGNGPSALSASRSPFTVARLLRESNLPCLDVRHTLRMGTERARWLRKPLRSAAGRDICFADDLPVTEEHTEPRFYYQRYVEGASCSAVFVANQAEDTRLLGVTRQLIGEHRLNAKPFQYCGSIGPIELPGSALATLQRIGEVLTAGCHLRGLFGIDFILNDDGPWLVEVNPRYTASVEVLEYATNTAFLTLYRRAFEPALLVPLRQASGMNFFGKAILYARERIIIPAKFSRPERSFDPDMPFVMPAAADVPSIGEVIEPGWPICTVFAHEANVEQCYRRLLQYAGDIYEYMLGD